MGAQRVGGVEPDEFVVAVEFEHLVVADQRDVPERSVWLDGGVVGLGVFGKAELLQLDRADDDVGLHVDHRDDGGILVAHVEPLLSVGVGYIAVVVACAFVDPLPYQTDLSRCEGVGVGAQRVGGVELRGELDEQAALRVERNKHLAVVRSGDETLPRIEPKPGLAFQERGKFLLQQRQHLLRECAVGRTGGGSALRAALCARREQQGCCEEQAGGAEVAFYEMVHSWRSVVKRET